MVNHLNVIITNFCHCSSSDFWLSKNHQIYDDFIRPTKLMLSSPTSKTFYYFNKYLHDSNTTIFQTYNKYC